MIEKKMFEEQDQKNDDNSTNMLASLEIKEEFE